MIFPFHHSLQGFSRKEGAQKSKSTSSCLKINVCSVFKKQTAN